MSVRYTRTRRKETRVQSTNLFGSVNKIEEEEVVEIEGSGGDIVVILKEGEHQGPSFSTTNVYNQGEPEAVQGDV